MSKSHLNHRGMAAVMAEVEAMRPMLQARRLRDEQERPLTDDEWDRRRDLDERGLSASDAWAEEHPLQSSATARRY